MGMHLGISLIQQNTHHYQRKSSCQVSHSLQLYSERIRETEKKEIRPKKSDIQNNIT